MSSNIQVQKVCEFCRKEFTARKTTTRTCSDYCAKRLYKQKRMNTKIESINENTQLIKTKPIEELKMKEFLTVKDAAQLLNCSIRTTYRLIKNGSIKGKNLSERKTLIKRSEIDKLFA